MVGSLVGATVGDDVGREDGEVVGASVGGIWQYSRVPHGACPSQDTEMVPTAPLSPAITRMKLPVLTSGDEISSVTPPCGLVSCPLKKTVIPS